jgi:hypothetical protein
MKVCPTCKSERVQEYLVGWHDANNHDLDLNQEPQALATLYPDQYWCLECGKRQESLLEVEDPERPPWWELPEDVAASQAKEMNDWYCGEGGKPYLVAEVQEAWKTVRLRMCEPEDDNEPAEFYAEVFFYSMENQAWGMGLDTADREWISNMIDTDRTTRALDRAKGLLTTLICPVCKEAGKLCMRRALVETYTADGAREEDTDRTEIQCLNKCVGVDEHFTEDRRDNLIQAFAIYAHNQEHPDEGAG